MTGDLNQACTSAESHPLPLSVAMPRASGLTSGPCGAKWIRPVLARFAAAVCGAPSLAQSGSTAGLKMPASHNPLSPYRSESVPEPSLANSDRLRTLIRDGKLYLSLQDAIDLALENNLDLSIARYIFPISEADILRTRAGAFFRGVNTGVVQ